MDKSNKSEYKNSNAKTFPLIIYENHFRFETERQEAEKNVERLENELELSTIRSRQSSKLSSIIAAAAVNPAFAETEFTG
jgi:hypothetical protein